MEGKQAMVLALSDEEILKMKEILLDADCDEALSLIRAFVKRLKQQKNAGMQSHLGK